MSEQKYWPCEHIKQNKRLDNPWYYWAKCPTSFSPETVPVDHMACVYCGAKRPEPAKDWMVEVMQKSYMGGILFPDLFALQAKAIREYIKAHGSHCGAGDPCCNTCDRWKKFLGIESEEK